MLNSILACNGLEVSFSCQWRLHFAADDNSITTYSYFFVGRQRRAALCPSLFLLDCVMVGSKYRSLALQDSPPCPLAEGHGDHPETGWVCGAGSLADAETAACLPASN